LSDDADLTRLREGEITVEGRMPYSSNGTFLVRLALDGDSEDDEELGVYKPIRGERPLWDFPSGLARREVAAYELSKALRWELVPPTVFRDGPLGEGSVQRFVDADFSEHYFTLREDERYDDAFRRLCAFDLVANSTDRKGGHCLVDEDHHIWAIDNGLSFHHEFKVRTVIWDYAGEYLPSDVVEGLTLLLDDGLPDDLAELLDPFERDAVLTRAGALLQSGCFPHDPTGHRYPWPLV
jgi:uncharacterized repeat protein (TIGR03843 family)